MGIPGQSLRGLVGQSMSGNRTGGLSTFANFPATRDGSAYSWSVPQTGWYRIVQWGPGGASVSIGDGGAGSGAYCETVVPLNQGQIVTVDVGRRGQNESTVVTLPGGRVIVAGAGGNVSGSATPGTGGVASGGDYMLNGSAGGAGSGGTGSDGTAGLGTGGGAAGLHVGSSGGGAGAPARLPFRGGSGYYDGSGVGSGLTPAGGGALGSGGDGMVLILSQPSGILN